MVMMSDLPRDLVEEVLSRVPLESLRAVRFTCKTWNSLSYCPRFTKNQIGKAKAPTKEELQVIVVRNFRVYLMSVNLHGVDNNFDLSTKYKAKLIRLNEANHRLHICRVLDCDGLLLCITKGIYSRVLVVWNPYFGQTMWIKPRISYRIFDIYALGYESGKNNSYLSHKILRVGFREFRPREFRRCEFRQRELELYSFKSNSWKVLDVSPYLYIEPYQRGWSLKGNTYLFAKRILVREEEEDDDDCFLICFDFTTERFGPVLPLPFHSTSSDKTTLSIVGGDQLAVLFSKSDSTLMMEIWVTSKIGPEEVSWNKLFVAVDMPGLKSLACPASFFVDQKKNVAVVFDRKSKVVTISNIAYILGTDGYFKQVDLGESEDLLVFSNYVLSSVKIEQLTN